MEHFVTDLELPISIAELEAQCEKMGLDEVHTNRIVNTWEASSDYASFINAMNQNGDSRLLSEGHRWGSNRASRAVRPAINPARR